MRGEAPNVKVKREMPASASSREQFSSSAIVPAAMEYPDTEIETILYRGRGVLQQSMKQ